MDVLATLPTPDLTAGANLARTASTKANDPRSPEAIAKGFESMFLSLLMKEMRGTLEPGAMFGGDSGDVYGGLFDQMMGDHLAQAGSLGIATMVRKHLASHATPHEPHPDVPETPGAQRVAGPRLP
jgi:Rod binding domain-containing protein